MKISLIIAPLISSLLVLGCEGHYQPVLPDIEYKLVIVDSVGVEIGNNDCIIGLPTEAAFTPDGNVAVLDLKKHAITLFSTDGSFIEQIGQEGEGPGDLTRPSGFGICPEGSILISDAIGISRFDPSYNFYERITLENTVRIISVFDDGSIFGNDMRYVSSDGELMIVASYGKWNSNIEQVVEYYETRIPASVLQPSGDGKIHESDIRHYCVASSSGRAFFTEKTREEFTITGYEADGSEYLQIHDDNYLRVRRTDSEIQYLVNRQQSYWSTIFGSSVSSQFDYVPDPYRPAIGEIFVDHEERLWVQLGYFHEMVFRVYDMNGNILFHAMLENRMDTGDFLSWKVTGNEHGFLAFDANPRDAVRIYVMELQRNYGDSL